MDNTLQETKHIVAYMDFLGAKKQIFNNDMEFLNRLSNIYENAYANCQKVNDSAGNENLPPIKQQTFSDNIVFAQEIYTEKIVYQVFNFILFISAYLHQALLAGFLVRGGITIGNVYIDNTFVSGKALIKAYQLESEIAIYPRVVIDFDVYGILSLLNEEIMQRFRFHMGDDLLYCIDAFRVVYKPEGYSIAFETIREAILKICKFEKNFKIMQKHLWIINQFNDFCIAQKQEQYKINVLQDYARVEQLTSV